MSEPFIAEIKMVGFNYPPPGWAFCDGQILPINQYQSLYSLLSTTYGGDGETSFALPDLRGRHPIHRGDGIGLPSYDLGQKGGEATHVLTSSEMPSHSHQAAGVSNDTADSTDSTDSNKAVPARSLPNFPGWSDTSNITMNSLAVSNSGGGRDHENRQPYLGVYFCIALMGIFPPE